MMKNAALLLLLILAFQLNAIENPEITAAHEIQAITVYLNTAEITRSSNVAIPAGKSDLLFKGISSRIMDQGLKISISNKVQVYAVNIESNDNSLAEDIAYQKLIDSTNQLIETKSILHLNLETLTKEIQYLEANMQLGGNSAKSFAAIDEGAKYFRARITEIQQKIYAERSELENLRRKEIELELVKKKLRASIEKTNAIVRVTVINASPSTSSIELRYLVSNALWKPYYALRASGKDQSMLIEYQAQVYNDTGNDWINKPLTLAILNSSDDVTKPELTVWTLDGDEYKKSKARTFSNKNEAVNQKDEAEEQNYDILQVDDLSTRFTIEDLHLIPSDATPHLIDVIKYTKEVEYYTLSIPKVKNGAFKIARIKNWESLGLLDGRANLFFDDTYQGFSILNTQPINDTLDIALGKENTYTISRKKVSTRSRKSLIGANIREIINYEIQVKNNKNQIGTLQIRDQIPIANSKDIEVKPLGLSGGKLDPVSGLVTWDVEMKPNEIKKINLRFSIRYPKHKRSRINYDRASFVAPRFF